MNLIQWLALGSAVLFMALACLIIWYQYRAQQYLRLELTRAVEQRAVLQATLDHAGQQQDELKITSPMSMEKCLSCQTPLRVVLCPHCHTPYHQEISETDGTTIHCWEEVLRSGQCWRCRGDLTRFQSGVAAGALDSTMPAGGPVPPRAVPPAPPADDEDFTIVTQR